MSLELKIENTVTRHYLAAVVQLSVLSIDSTYIDKNRLTTIFPWKFVVEEDGESKVTEGPELILCDDKLVQVLQMLSSKASVDGEQVDYVKDLKGAGFKFL